MIEIITLIVSIVGLIVSVVGLLWSIGVDIFDRVKERNEEQEKEA